MLIGKVSSCALAATFVSLIVLALMPWGVKAIVDPEPLRPDELAETPRAYKPTEEAYTTREAEAEKSATSQFEVLPAEGEEVAQAVTITPTHGTDVVIVPESITATAMQNLPIYRCPYPSEQTENVWPANQEFSILGWNIDLDNVVYFLIEDNPAQAQTWIRFEREVTLSFENYKLVYPFAAACRTWTDGGTSTAVQSETEVTPTIPLPEILTATPPPPQPIQIELTEEEATEQVKEDIPELKEPSVRFTPDEIRITGKVEASTIIGSIDGDVEIKGTLELRDGKLYLHATSVTARGRDYTDDEEGQQAESTVNIWLARLMIRREAESFELRDGSLSIHAVEYQESVFPTLVPTDSTPIPGTDTTPVESEMSGTPTAIPLPDARPITATPQTSIPFEVTDSEATIEAIKNLTTIANPTISFTSSGVVIVGQFTSPVDIPGQNPFGTVSLSGGLSLESGQLQMDFQEITFNGADITQPTVRSSLEIAVNTWLPSLQRDKPITDFSLDEGLLTLFP